MPTTTPSIPLIDFAEFGDGTTEKAKIIAHEMLTASTVRGFMYLTNHGVPQSLIDRMFEHSERFFGLSREIRRSVLRPQNGHDARGWVAPGAGNVTQDVWNAEDVKKAKKESPSEFELYLVGSTTHPTLKNRLLPETLMPGFAADAEEFIQTCNNVYRRILMALAIALGLGDVHYFDKYHARGGESNFSLNHSSEGSLEDFALGRFGAHTDYGYITILFQGAIGGLEVADALLDGAFVPAPPIPGSAVVNIGDLMQRWSNDILRSTLHRVQTPPHLVTDGRVSRRFSIPFFGSPDADTVVDALPGCWGPERPKLHKAINGRQHIIRRQELQYTSNDD